MKFFKKKDKQHEEMVAETMHALQKLHKKWPPGYYLAVRVSYFDADVNQFFSEREESISFKLALSEYNNTFCGTGVYVFKKATAQEMFDFIQKHNANFPDVVQIRGHRFLRS